MSEPAASAPPQPEANHSDLRIEPVASSDDFPPAFDCVREAFGRQSHDGIWTAANPGWDTEEGRVRGAARLESRWRATTLDDGGASNAVFLKATLPDEQKKQDRKATVTVGFAIWLQASAVSGRGVIPTDDAAEVAATMDLASLYPDDPAEQRYISQVLSSLHKRRAALVREKASASPPAVFALELCAVDPRFQRRGVATALVQWGLDEARRRGGLEAVTEASTMGRSVYSRLGFRQEGPEIEYTVDEQFADRKRPSNIFMRTAGAE